MVAYGGPGDGLPVPDALVNQWYLSQLTSGLTVEISDEKNYPGVKIYQSRLVAYGSAVTLPGIGILIHPSITGIDMVQTLQHEYGHYLDYKFSPDLNQNMQSPSSMLNFYVAIGIPSIFNAATGFGGNHYSYWTEIRANQWAKNWFGASYISDEYYYPTK